MNLNNIIKTGNKCLEDREDIPSAPLWHMGKVAVLESKESFDLLQNTIDYLACKAKLNKPFSANEKEFMKELYEAMWWGGQYLGYHEAARLANHYVNGDGKKISINPEVYKRSVIVSDAIVALKGYIRQRATEKKAIKSVSTGHASFFNSGYARSLIQGRSPSRQGYMLYPGGALVSEQSNIRLHKADNRFFLQADTSKHPGYFISRWFVESIYDFEPFPKDYITDLDLTNELTLKLPDGLSQHLTKIGVAKVFRYTTSWHERWA